MEKFPRELLQTHGEMNRVNKNSAVNRKADNLDFLEELSDKLLKEFPMSHWKKSPEENF